MDMSVGIKVGLINIGVEGQMLAGAMCAALVGAYCTWLPGPLLLIVALLAGMIGGGLTFLLCTWMKTQFGAEEVITSIMMNTIMANLTDYLSNGPLKPPTGFRLGAFLFLVRLYAFRGMLRWLRSALSSALRRGRRSSFSAKHRCPS